MPRHQIPKRKRRRKKRKGREEERREEERRDEEREQIQQLRANRNQRANHQPQTNPFFIVLTPTVHNNVSRLTRHVNSAHPTLRKEQPDAKPTNLRATRGFGVVETPLHVLQECPRLLSLRQQHFPKPFSKDNPIPWFSASLFKFFHAALQQLKPDGAL